MNHPIEVQTVSHQMSHWSELMEDRPHLDSVEYKHRDALWGLFRAELVYLVEQLKIIRDVRGFD